jgi:hypothetical protein
MLWYSPLLFNLGRRSGAQIRRNAAIDDIKDEDRAMGQIERWASIASYVPRFATLTFRACLSVGWPLRPLWVLARKSVDLGSIRNDTRSDERPK